MDQQAVNPLAVGGRLRRSRGGQKEKRKKSVEKTLRHGLIVP
jgi:hypothetical protein